MSTQGQRQAGISRPEVHRCTSYPSPCPCSQLSVSDLSLADFTFTVPESKAALQEDMNCVLFQSTLGSMLLFYHVT